jgi:hypothetical protein
MSSTLQIGPFVLQTQGLIIVLSTLIGYYSLHLRLKRHENIEVSVKSQVVETIELAAIMAIVLWKFSWILFNPVRAFANPSSLLYYSGGERGSWLAALAVIAYFYYRSKKESNSIWLYADLLTSGFLVSLGVYSLFALFGNLNKAWFYGSEVLLALLVYQLHFRKSEGLASLKSLNQALLWFCLGQVFVFFLNPLRQNFWRGFSKIQGVLLILAAFCIALDFIVANRVKEGR